MIQFSDKAKAIVVAVNTLACLSSDADLTTKNTELYGIKDDLKAITTEITVSPDKFKND